MIGGSSCYVELHEIHEIASGFDEEVRLRTHLSPSQYLRANLTPSQYLRHIFPLRIIGFIRLRVHRHLRNVGFPSKSIIPFFESALSFPVIMSTILVRRRLHHPADSLSPPACLTVDFANSDCFFIQKST